MSTSVVEFAGRVHVAAISCVGEAHLRQQQDGCAIAVKGARYALEEQATMSKAEFERRRPELMAIGRARGESWLKARGAVHTFMLEEPPG